MTVGNGGIVTVINNTGSAMVVDITNEGGSRATAYTDDSFSATHTLPKTITATTSFWVHEGTYDVSVKVNDVEVASTPDGVRRVILSNWQQIVFAPSLDDARVADQSGTYAPITTVSVRATDDLATVLGAVTANTRVVLAKGATFDVNSTITISANKVTIDGQGATVRLGAATTGTAASFDRILTLSGTDVLVENVNFGVRAGGSNSVDPVAANVRLDGTRVTVRRCTFVTGSVIAMRVTGSGARILDNYVSGSEVVYSNSGADACIVARNTIDNAPLNALSGVGNGGGGVYNEDCLVADNIINAPGRMGIEDQQNTRRTIIRGNRINNAVNTAISAVGFGTLVEGNTILDPPAGIYGIEASADGTVIRGNTITYIAVTPNSSSRAIIVNGMHTVQETGAVVVGNTINAPYMGIVLSGTLTVATVSDNLIVDAIQRAISLAPTGAEAISCSGNTIRFNSAGNSGAGFRDGITTGGCIAINITGNTIHYTASSAGTANEFPIRPVANSSVICGNTVNGGGRVDAKKPVVSTNGGTPSNLLIVGNAWVNGATLSTTSMVTPTTANNITV